MWCGVRNETQGFPPAKNRLSSSATIQASTHGYYFFVLIALNCTGSRGFEGPPPLGPKDLGKVGVTPAKFQTTKQKQSVYLTCKISKDKEIDNRQSQLCVMQACSHPDPQEAGARGVPGVSLGDIETLS